MRQHSILIETCAIRRERDVHSYNGETRCGKRTLLRRV